ncbi:alpha/beta hydrolase [Streptomyces sp. B1866]|uniref:alpha/beta fold hydrolase n=1 Tax=Streptomyces sp. B1866 TaxID=3075431 RepID=UPI002890EA83|nr:alpha/beta hydrolase [Streptomyces sp. B1866]MDT3397553.1 alpha/beta hydrolase [Streptomyces sp. B1866]
MVGPGWRNGAGIAGAAVGVAAGVALERLTAGRGVRRRARLALDAQSPFGSLRGAPGTAVADDGTELYYEVEEARAPLPAPQSSLRGRLLRRRPPDPLTVVFSHGYCLNQDSWHYQRAALRGAVRAVYWDQRCHGRSARGCAQRDGAPLTMDQLGRDLKAVIDAAAPTGPLVLVGHSMGGMTVMALAAQYPDLVRERVVGAAFVSTSAGRLSEISFGLPVVGVNAVRRVLPGLLRALGKQAELVERGRRATADFTASLVKRYSFGSQEVDPAVARFAERLIGATPIDVVAEFYPAFTDHDKAAALPVFGRVPVLVLAGERDLITPVEHSRAVAAVLPEARLEIVPDAGHLVILEHPEVVNARLIELLPLGGAG